METKNLGALIKQRMDQLGIKNKQLALELNIDKRTVGSILKANFMQTDRLERLCVFLNYNFFEYFTRQGSQLEKFGHQACDEVRLDNEKLRQQVSDLHKTLQEAQETIAHQKKLTDILSLTVEKQEQYLKEQKERKRDA